MTVLDVDTISYAAAARTVGGELAGALIVFADDAAYTLNAAAGMAGSDPIGTAWGTAYDRAACQALSLMCDCADAAFCIAALLEQTGINYAGAEAAAVPGETPAQSQARWAASSAPRHELASSVGTGLPAPAGWSPLAAAVGLLWPDGHQDRLRTAAGAWADAGRSIRSIVPDHDRATEQVSVQRGPEVLDAVAVMNDLRAHLLGLADLAEQLGTLCSDYAHHIDAAHHEIITETVRFIDDTIAIQTAGGLFAVMTFGVSELVAQGGELAAVAHSASVIKAVIEALRGVVAPLSHALEAVSTRALAVSDRLGPILLRTPQAAALERPGIAGQVVPAIAMTPKTSSLVRLEKEADDVAPTAIDGIGHAGRHRFPGVLQRKSQFFDDADLQLLADTRDVVGVRQANGNTRFVMHAVHDIGIDHTTGCSTDVYTVIRRPDGQVLTMFPGTSRWS